MKPLSAAIIEKIRAAQEEMKQNPEPDWKTFMKELEREHLACREETLKEERGRRAERERQDRLDELHNRLKFSDEERRTLTWDEFCLFTGLSSEQLAELVGAGAITPFQDGSWTLFPMKQALEHRKAGL